MTNPLFVATRTLMKSRSPAPVPHNPAISNPPNPYTTRQRTPVRSCCCCQLLQAGRRDIFLADHLPSQQFGHRSRASVAMATVVDDERGKQGVGKGATASQGARWSIDPPSSGGGRDARLTSGEAVSRNPCTLRFFLFLSFYSLCFPLTLPITFGFAVSLPPPPLTLSLSTPRNFSLSFPNAGMCCRTPPSLGVQRSAKESHKSSLPTLPVFCTRLLRVDACIPFRCCNAFRSLFIFHENCVSPP